MDFLLSFLTIITRVLDHGSHEYVCMENAICNSEEKYYPHTLLQKQPRHGPHGRLFCVCNGIGSFLVAICVVSERRDESPAEAWIRRVGAVSRYTYSISLLSLSLFRACSCVWPVAGPRDEAGRTGTSEEWERREGLTEARQALYERGGHRGPLPSPLMFNSCVWALAGRRRRRRSVREECEDA